MEKKVCAPEAVQSGSALDLSLPGIRIAPSLLSADFARLESVVAVIEASGAEMLHLDVMDGHFVPNISFGVPVIASLRKRSGLFFDAHLMISDPQQYVEAFVQAGCQHITFHIEAVKKPTEVVARIKNLGATVGISLNPTTPADAVRDIIGDLDMVLVMSVWPGFGGQAFIEDVLPKVTALRRLLRDDQRLEIDGGIDRGTIGPAAAAGADTFVAGTAVFRADDPPAAMLEMQRLACEAAGRR